MSDSALALIKSDAALEAVVQSCGSRDAAIRILSDALRGGMLRAYGVRDVGARLQGGNRRSLIETDIWERAHLEDQSRWSWSGGYFCSREREYRQVHFDAGQVTTLCAGAGIKPQPAAEQSIEGKRVASKIGTTGKVEAWHGFYMQLLIMMDEGDLERSNFPTQKALRDELLRRIDDDLSDASIKSIVAKVWHKFIENQ